MDGEKQVHNTPKWPQYQELRTSLRQLGLSYRQTFRHINKTKNLKAYVGKKVKIMMSQDFTQWDMRRWDKDIPMVHPDMLWLHGKRVGKFAKLLAIILKKGNEDKAEFFGEIHDLAEYASPLGDVSREKKNKASKTTIEILKLIENAAGEYLSELYLPTELANRGINQAELTVGLEETGEYTTVESQVARLADILDATLYPILEIRSGNTAFDTINKNGISIGYLEDLRNKDLFPGLFDRVLIDFGELLGFIANPHTNTPPKLYMDWLNIWKDVQDEYAYNVWSEKLPGYSEPILGLLYQKNTFNNEKDTFNNEKDTKKGVIQPSKTPNYNEELLALGCSNDDIQGMTSRGKHKVVEITTHSLTGNISVRVEIGKKSFQTFYLAPYIHDGIKKMDIKEAPLFEGDISI